MAEYIDRGALLDTLRRNLRATERGSVCYDCVMSAVEAVEAAPAADVVEVVRCRDCKHAPLFWDEDDPFAVKWPQQRGMFSDLDDETCPHFVGDYSYTRPPDPDGFCEKGERKQ